MTVVFDLDNTLVDESGSSVRPGIAVLLERLRRRGHILVLWTNSRRGRAREILETHGLQKYFHKSIFREDYDPEGKGVRKGIRKVKGDVLVDDDPEEIAYVRSSGKMGILIRPFRKGSKSGIHEIPRIYDAIVGYERPFRRVIKLPKPLATTDK